MEEVKQIQVKMVFDDYGKNTVPTAIAFEVFHENCPHMDDPEINQCESYGFVSCLILGDTYGLPPNCPYCKGIVKDDEGKLFTICKI